MTRARSLDALLSEVASGDQSAFEELYNLTAPRVFGLTLRVLRNRAMAEEAAQEALLDVWRQAARFDASRGSAISWVLTFAHRRAVDYVRSAQSSADREKTAGFAAPDVPFDEAADTAMRRAEGEQVRDCLRGLTELQRESITLAYYAGLSYPQVAQKLAVGLPTIKARMRDGLIRLRDCLGVR
ncbi:ECF RNA polymerase sigma factor SigK [Phytomonospora endophytica]|uniref:RNA polymerase sigma-70 factor (ECF subfamily) n=1 Tax=Phytomonospora endophytica TaxID=714109 RepID=A0A841G1N2_9ACTN|nr:ECF RNA polymerase sigma factor SigK [Phytomonospora endophytica]MBB6038589.1 RNA polymerase sigma-70 factor (ECF subfamily) [Phytomonospora endophytica]GIG69268.1 RNA polymerase sigma factor SigK [Phytomonospora endophytica]